MFLDGVRHEHGEWLGQQGSRSEAGDGLAGGATPERVDRPALADRRHERDQQQHPQQAVSTVQHGRIPPVKREQEHQRDDPDQSCPVADDERHREQSGQDEQQLLEPQLPREEVQRPVVELCVAHLCCR